MSDDQQRRGITLVEILVGMVILALAGLSVARIMMFQTRYYEHQSAGIQARGVSRGPLMRLVGDLRMVEASGGIVSASDTSFVVHAPYALGITCTGVVGNTYVSLLPVDSAMYAAPGFSGYAYRRSDGGYTYVESGSPLLDFLGDINLCNLGVVTTLLADRARIVKIPMSLASAPISLGTPVFLYRNIRYSFRPSQTVSGARGLYRTVLATGATEELAAPFATTAKFRYYVKNSHTASAAAPADLSTLRGVQLVLDATSEWVPTGAKQKAASSFTTSVYFKNRLN